LAWHVDPIGPRSPVRAAGADAGSCWTPVGVSSTNDGDAAPPMKPHGEPVPTAREELEMVTADKVREEDRLLAAIDVLGPTVSGPPAT
jgi:hypothetical protein